EPDVLVEQGRLEISGHDYPAAIGHLQRAVDLVPQMLSAHNLLAIALERAGRRQEARPHFDFVEAAGAANTTSTKLKDWVRLHPNDIEARYELGLLNVKYISGIEGAAWLLSVVDLDPNHQGAHAALAEYYAQKAPRDEKFQALATRHQKWMASPN